MSDLLPGDLCVVNESQPGYSYARGIRYMAGSVRLGDLCLIISVDRGFMDVYMSYVLTQNGHAFWTYSGSCTPVKDASFQ